MYGSGQPYKCLVFKFLTSRSMAAGLRAFWGTGENLQHTILHTKLHTHTYSYTQKIQTEGSRDDQRQHDKACWVVLSKLPPSLLSARTDQKALNSLVWSWYLFTHVQKATSSFSSDHGQTIFDNAWEMHVIKRQAVTHTHTHTEPFLIPVLVEGPIPSIHLSLSWQFR